MVQLTGVNRWFRNGCAAALGVLAAVVILGAGDAQAASAKAIKTAQAAQQVAMLGEPVRDGDLQKSRGTGLETQTPNVVQPSGGLAVILWDEPGQGKPGTGNAFLSGTVTVNGSVISK